jgi:O-antigen ligase
LTLVLVLLVLFVFVQKTLLPYGVLKVISPLSSAIASDSADVLAQIGLAETGNDPSNWDNGATISVSPAATHESIILLISYVSCFLVLLNTMTRWRHFKHAAAVIVVSGAVMSVVAIIHKLSGSREIFWFHIPRYGGSICGPFTNRNHFAAHVNMLLGMTLGLLWASTQFRELRKLSQWREKLAWFSTKRASRIALLGFAAVIMVGGLLVSLSRGGIVSLAISLGVVGLMVSLGAGRIVGGWARIASIAALILAACLWIGWEPVIERLGTLADLAENPLGDSRAVATRSTLEMWAASPIFGVGLGTFRHVFPMFRDSSLQFGRWLHAHNDWVEFLAETGIAGMALLMLACILWVRSVIQRFPHSINRSKLFVLGLTIGLVAIGVHSFVDYSLHKAANAYLCATLAAMVLAAVHVRTVADEGDGNYRDHDEEQIAPRRRIGSYLARLCALVLLALLVGSTVTRQGAFGADLAFVRFLYLQRRSSKAGDVVGYQATVRAANREASVVVSQNRADPDVLREIAAASFSWVSSGDLEWRFRRGLVGRTIECAVLAVRAAPSDYLAWLWLARTQALIGKWDEAEICLERARELVTPGTKIRLLQ